MKIGVLTYHSVSNFGANLQALSTVSYFKKAGHDVKIIDWFPKELEKYYINNVSAIQREQHRLFVEERLPLTQHCETSADVERVINEEKFDLVAIGSDAVFSYIPFLKRIHPSRKTLIGITNTTPDHKIPNPFWADFAKNNKKVKVVSLSASAQYLDIDKCLPWNKWQLKSLLKNFDLLYVRDRWTQGIISSLTDKEVTISPDPVFGFNLNVEQQLSEKEIKEKYNLDKYIVLSFCKKLFNDSWYETLYKNLKEKGYEVINLAMPEGCVDIPCDRKIDVPLPPMDWYAIIKHAQGYIGQRMHPMIVAFNNIVPFLVFDHYAYKKGKDQLKSSKIYDVLERGGVLTSYHNISGKETITPEQVVNTIINFDKEKVAAFIKSYQERYLKMMNHITNLL